MPKQQDFWGQLNADCHALAPDMGAIAGGIYGFGAEVSTENSAFAASVEHIVGDYVGDHWGDTCDLPQNISNAIAPDSTPATSPTTDSSPSQSPASSSVGMDM